MIVTISRCLRGGCLGGGAVAVALGLSACGGASSAPASAQQTAVASSGTCPTPAARARAALARTHSEQRYATEVGGIVIHADLLRIARDATLVGALEAGNLPLAQEAANRQLVQHVVRIRVYRGSRVIVDANPTSFDVGGSSITLRDGNGRGLGRMQITVQDVIGFIKLNRRLYHSQTVVRGPHGQMRTSLLAATRVALPSSGCVRVGRRTYVVNVFPETSFTGEALRVWLLTPA
jgi:hypothetical protein